MQEKRILWKKLSVIIQKFEIKLKTAATCVLMTFREKLKSKMTRLSRRKVKVKAHTLYTQTIKLQFNQKMTFNHMHVIVKGRDKYKDEKFLPEGRRKAAGGVIGEIASHEASLSLFASRL